MYYVLWDQVFVSQITNNLLGGTNSFEAQDQFRPCRLWNSPTRDSETSSYFVPFLWDEVFALLIKKLGKIICWGGNNSHLGMFFHYTDISCSMGPLGACKMFRFINKLWNWNVPSNFPHHKPIFALTIPLLQLTVQLSDHYDMVFNFSLQKLLGVLMLGSLHLLSSSQCCRFLDQTNQH